MDGLVHNDTKEMLLKRFNHKDSDSTKPQTYIIQHPYMLHCYKKW